ncbi:proteasome subunit beta type-2 [Tanacetum coccineum]
MQRLRFMGLLRMMSIPNFFMVIVNRNVPFQQLSVKGVMVDGEWVDEPNRVKEEFRSHFANRFQDTGVSRCRLNFRFPSRLTADQISDLEKPVSSDEIRKAVWSCGKNKSPGPDGFTFEFFRKYWDFHWPDKNSSDLSVSRTSRLGIIHCNLRSIIQMLHCFSLASGLKINLQKSNLLGVGVTGSLVNEAAASHRAWDLNGDGDFCVKDARDLVDEVLLPKENVATRWIKTIPIKEDTSHLFFSCDVALAISRLICRWWNVSWSPVDSYSGWVLIPETTFVGVESRVSNPETTFVGVESRVLSPETTFVGVESRVRVLHVPFRYQFADIFTKGLPSALFEEFRTSLSVRCPPAPTAREIAQFTEYVQKNVSLYQFRNGIPLTTKAAANFMRNELATALRKNPYQVNIILAGYEKETGPSLYFIDYIATLHKVDKAAFGYGSYFALSMMDRHYHPDMTVEEAIKLADQCIDEIRSRLVVAPQNFVIKIVDKDGAREHSWRRTTKE